MVYLTKMEAQFIEETLEQVIDHVTQDTESIVVIYEDIQSALEIIKAVNLKEEIPLDEQT